MFRKDEHDKFYSFHLRGHWSNVQPDVLYFLMSSGYHWHVVVSLCAQVNQYGHYLRGNWCHVQNPDVLLFDARVSLTGCDLDVCAG
jgi:hypothetical protein